MKILQLCKKYPFPIKDGESLAITSLAQALHRAGCSMTLLAMNTSRHRADLERCEATIPYYIGVHTVEVDNAIHPFDALRNLLFTSDSYHVERYDVEMFDNALRDLLRKEHFDVVQLETIYLAPYIKTIRAHSDAKIVLRAHNVEHEIWERIATNSHWLKRWYLHQITPRLKAFEVEHLNQYDMVAGITARDLEQFDALGLNKPSIVIPVGLDTDQYPENWSAFQRKPLSLSFIGSLDWMPNSEGLEWFLREIWQPVLRPRFPELVLHIAGRNAPDWLTNHDYTGVHYVGEVPDAADFLLQHPITIAPLLSGSGIRVKLLEGIALGRVVIASSMGLEGIDLRHQQEGLIADTPEAWAEAIAWCIAHERLQSVGEAARRFCKEHFDGATIVAKLTDAYENLLATEEIHT
jgi:polysaccharide biosynthesis protein PslH